MQILKIALLNVICIMCFVQCDTTERRISKAEDVIEKHLFETLDNYQSYERISTEVDTLKEIWMTNQEIMALVKQVYEIRDARYEADDELTGLRHKGERMVRRLYSGDSNAVWDLLANSGNLKDQITQLEEKINKLDSLESVNIAKIYEMYWALKTPEKPYWHVKQKFRYSANGQDSRIYMFNFVCDPDVKEIIYSWEEDSPMALGLFRVINDAKGD